MKLHFFTLMGDAEQRLHRCGHSAATDTGTLSCSQPPTKHVFHMSDITGLIFQLLEQRNSTNMSLTKDFSLFDCIYNECTVRAAWRSVVCTHCSTEAELWAGPQARLVRWPITVVNVEHVSVRPESLATCSRCTQPLTPPQLGWTPPPLVALRYERLGFWMKWWRTEAVFLIF